MKELLEKIKLIESKRDKLVLKLNQLNVDLLKCKNELKDQCTHEKTEIKEEFVSGGYLDRSTNTKILKCIICNKILDTKVEVGGYA